MVKTIVDKALAVFVLITFFFSTSCTSTRAIKARPYTMQNELRKGDVVEITTKDHSKFEFEIVEISIDFIVGYRFWGRGGRKHEQSIFFSEIAKIEKTEISVGKSIGAAFGVVFGIAMILGAIVSIILASSSPNLK